MVLVNVEEGPLQSEKAASKKFAGKLSQPSVYEVIYRGQTHVRVRLLQWRREPSYAEFLKQLVTKLSGVTDVRFNRSAYSLSVAYDPGLITGDALEAALLDCCETAFTHILASQPSSESMYITQTRQTVGYQVVHQTPWRLRLRLPRLAEDAEYACRLIALANSVRGTRRPAKSKGAVDRH